MSARLGGSSLKCDIRKQQAADGSGQIKHKLFPYKVVILHPSMCCPELIHPDDIDKPIKLIVVTDDEFHRDCTNTS